MKKFFAITLVILTVLCILTIPAYAGEVTEVVTEAVTEVATETPVTKEVTGEISAEETEGVTYAETESETTLPFDQWLYNVLQTATPEQVEMIEEIVLGGVGALDKLGIKGFDRVRVWVEYNMATVLTVLLMTALVAFFVVTVIQKKGFAKKADILNSNAIEMYEAGQAAAEEARAECRAYVEKADETIRVYAERADAICRECVDAAQKSAEEAKAAHGKVAEERMFLIAELEKTAKTNAALCETVNFLLQCSDLSQSKRDEAEAIYKKAQEAMSHDYTDEA